MTSHRSRIGIFMTDRDLVVRFWDSSMAEMTGFTKCRACGHCLTELLPNLKASPILAQFQHVLATGQLKVLAPTLYPALIACPPATPSGYFQQMQQHITIAPWRDQTLVVGTIVTVEDITTQLEQERKLFKQVQFK
jgi:PAS domain-containing protein